MAAAVLKVATWLSTQTGLSLGTAKAIVTLGALAAGSSLTQYLTTKQLTVGENRGRQLSNTAGGNEVGRIILGTALTGAHLTHRAVSGDENKYLWLVQSFAIHETEEWLTIWVNGIPIDVATEIDGSGFVTKNNFLDKNGNKLLQLKLYDGSQVTADAGMVAAVPEWTAAHVGNDITYLVARCEADFTVGDDHEDVWKGSEPIIQAELKGLNNVYDIDTAMEIWTDNPALLSRHFLTSTAPGIGYGEDVTRIDDNLALASTSISDEQVTVKDNAGGTVTQPRYCANGVVLSGQTESTLESLQASMGGAIVKVSGKWRIHAGAFPTPVSLTLTDNDVAGGLEFLPEPTLNERINQISGEFVDPARGGQSLAFKTQANAAWIASDGRVLEKNISLPLVSDRQHAQRVARIQLQLSRPVVVNGKFHLSAFPVEAYEVVPVSFASLNLAADMRITRWVFDGELLDLTLREETAVDYDVAVGDLLDHPYAVPPNVPLFSPAPPSGLAAVPLSNGIRFSWNNAAAGTIRATEVWLSADNDRANAYRAATTQSDELTIPAPGGGRVYSWVRHIGVNGMLSTWHPLSATAGVVGTGELGNDIILDPSFDLSSAANSDYWIMSAGVTIEDGAGRNGGNAMRHLSSGSPNAPKTVAESVRRIPAVNGQVRIRGTFMFDASGGTSWAFKWTILAYDDLDDTTGTTVSSATSTFTVNPGVWQTFSKQIVIPAGYSYFSLSFGWNSTAAVFTRDIYFDHLSMYRI